jgi:hypothetical protein
MSTYITLVSEQAIPNVQYIKEFAAQVDRYLFVSTERMEKNNSAKHIIDACALKPGSYKVIVINQESLSDILTKLEAALKEELFIDTKGFIVNCTLGTKVMSIALYEYFRNKDNAQLLYTPIGSNSYKGLTDEKFGGTFTQKVNVEEYVKSYGIGIAKSSSTLFPNINYTLSFFEHYMNFGENQHLILEALRIGENQKYRAKGLDDFSKISGLAIFLQNINFPLSSANILSAKEVRYLTGGWFEEWTYFVIKQRLGLNEKEILMGLNTVLNAENDLDVVFVRNNTFYIIECKTAIPDTYLQQTTLYKSGALVDKFGRNAKSYIFTLSNLRGKDGQFKKGVMDRSLQQNVIVADRQTLLNEFEDFMKNIFLQ